MSENTATNEVAKNIMDTIVTIFPDITRTKEPYYVSVGQVLTRIKTGKSMVLVNQIRALTEKADRDEIKKNLPSICFSGKFKYRGNNGIEQSSGLICLDFDHIKDLKKARENLMRDKYIFVCFLSPSGDGYKVLIKIPPIIENHAKYFEALRMYFQMNDYSGWDDLKDIARVCYESYDPDVYINPDSALFDIEIKPKPVVVEFSKDGDKLTDHNEVYRRLKGWAERTNSYHDGNKYRFLVYLSSACNRFGLPAELVVDRLVDEYQNRASVVKAEDFRDIVQRVYIAYMNQHGNSFFTVAGEMSDFDPEAPARDVVYMDSIRDEMIQSFLKGDAKGETTYYNSIDYHWRWKKGEISLMHGINNQGKTSLLIQLMLLKSVKEGTKWGIFSPEQNPPIDFYKELIHMYIGKTTEHYMPNQMSMAEYVRGMDFMKEHFYFVYPKTESPTPQYINDRFEELIIKHNISGCLTDPFNQLDNDWKSAGGRDDQYISSFAAKEKRFALDHNVYKLVIAHPKGGIERVTEKNQDKELLNAGNYACPDVFDLAGGPMWGNKYDNILCAYQPYYSSRVRAPKDPHTGERMVNCERHENLSQFISQKIKKQKLIGQPGTANLVFNILTARYHEENPMNPKVMSLYTPFDDEYIHKDNMAGETKMESTDWDAFKVWDDTRRTEDGVKKEHVEEEMMDELGLDFDEPDFQGYDTQDSSYDYSE